MPQKALRSAYREIGSILLNSKSSLMANVKIKSVSKLTITFLVDNTIEWCVYPLVHSNISSYVDIFVFEG